MFLFMLSLFFCSHLSVDSGIDSNSMPMEVKVEGGNGSRFARIPTL